MKGEGKEGKGDAKGGKEREGQGTNKFNNVN